MSGANTVSVVGSVFVGDVSENEPQVSLRGVGSHYWLVTVREPDGKRAIVAECATWDLAMLLVKALRKDPGLWLDRE